MNREGVAHVLAGVAEFEGVWPSWTTGWQTAYFINPFWRCAKVTLLGAADCDWWRAWLTEYWKIILLEGSPLSTKIIANYSFVVQISKGGTCMVTRRRSDYLCRLEARKSQVRIQAWDLSVISSPNDCWESWPLWPWTQKQVGTENQWMNGHQQSQQLVACYRTLDCGFHP